MTFGTFFIVAAPLVGLAASMVAQVVVHLLLPRKPIVVSYAAGFLCGAIVSLLTLSAFQVALGWADAVVCLLTFGGLNYCYSNFVNLNFTSLRIRLLKELMAAGGREHNGDRAPIWQRRYFAEAFGAFGRVGTIMREWRTVHRDRRLFSPLGAVFHGA